MDATASRRVFGGRASWWPRTGLLAAFVLVGILVQGCSDNNGRITGTESKVTGDAIGANVKTSVTINPGTIAQGRRASVLVIVSSPNGFPLVGRRVDLSSAGGRLDAITGITDANGRFATTVLAPCDTPAGTITVTAFADNQSQVAATATATVTPTESCVPAPPPAGGGGGPALPSVSITASDPSATESTGDTATFTVTRSASSASSLQVFFTVGGTATPGACPGDFTISPSGAVTIGANQLSATITVTPCNDGVPDGGETVVVTISSDAAYTGGGNAQVTIND